MDGRAELIGTSGFPDACGLGGAVDQDEQFDKDGDRVSQSAMSGMRQAETPCAAGTHSEVLPGDDAHCCADASPDDSNICIGPFALPPASAERLQFFDDCLEAQENERLKLGRELHDSTGQLLLALRLELGKLRATHPALAQGALLDEIEETVREIDREIRAFSFTRYPAEIGADGLGPALRSLACGFAKRTGLRIDFKSIPDSVSQTGEVALALLRVAQEALLNVHRHAKALHVQVALILRSGLLELTIRDDGIGIPGDHDLEESHGVGLSGMRHRMERLGGHFAIRRLKHGTKIVASVPA